ncbi:TTF-type zinc finger protein with HAT dimerization domain [Abeliophyllum distichum]|uniref:TTF-type zinc finger protein with HAT dimerization domain n=1 Tax=Abeliophyllum distichum TaxID=126358 RepID=A0ABD1V6E2_9LAMI
MKRFFQPQRKPEVGPGGTSCSSAASNAINTSSSTPSQSSLHVDNDVTKKSRVDINVDALDLEYDHGKRPPIESYDPNIRDEVRMIYLERGPCQPHVHSFPKTIMGKDKRCFRKEWFSDFHWLEYSIEKDAIFCLNCYLFKPDKEG